MNAFKKARLILGGLGLALLMSQASYAQAINSNNVAVNLTATLGETLTVGVAGGPVTFALVPSGSVNGNTLTITTAWALKTTRGAVKLYGYFASATALTDGSGDNIPVANVSGAVNGGAAATFTAATPFGGSTGLMFFSQALAAGSYNASRSDTLVMSINTTGLALPAATYTGTLNIQAQAL